MRERISKRAYTRLEQFEADVKLMCANARRFNGAKRLQLPVYVPKLRSCMELNRFVVIVLKGGIRLLRWWPTRLRQRWRAIPGAAPTAGGSRHRGTVTAACRHLTTRSALLYAHNLTHDQVV